MRAGVPPSDRWPGEGWSRTPDTDAAASARCRRWDLVAQVWRRTRWAGVAPNVQEAGAGVAAAAGGGEAAEADEADPDRSHQSEQTEAQACDAVSGHGNLFLRAEPAIRGLSGAVDVRHSPTISISHHSQTCNIALRDTLLSKPLVAGRASRRSAADEYPGRKRWILQTAGSRVMTGWQLSERWCPQVGATLVLAATLFGGPPCPGRQLVECGEPDGVSGTELSSSVATGYWEVGADGGIFAFGRRAVLRLDGGRPPQCGGRGNGLIGWSTIPGGLPCTALSISSRRNHPASTDALNSARFAAKTTLNRTAEMLGGDPSPGHDRCWTRYQPTTAATSRIVTTRDQPLRRHPSISTANCRPSTRALAAPGSSTRGG